MKYTEAESYLLEQLPMFQRVGAAAYRADLRNIIALTALMGNPQNGQRFIHIAGTNGKGSVTHLLAAALQAQGYSVGVFTSPHYKTYRERVKINGDFIPKRAVSSFVSKWKSFFQKVDASFFEITTAMAFWYFNKEKTDFVILETGMGGRLDSTNIVTPILSVITNISFDHQQFLGNTLPLIAAEKAGIMKPGIPVVIGETHPETKAVFIEKFRTINSRLEAGYPSAKLKSNSSCKPPSFGEGAGGEELLFADQTIALKNFQTDLKGASFEYNGKKYQTDLSGNYQQKNIKTALCALEFLRSNGVKLSNSAIFSGWKKVGASTYFIGRWMILKKEPLTIADSAHNEGGLREIAAQLKKLSYKKLHFVYGTVSDKDLSKIFPLLPKKATYYFCRPDIPRGKDEKELEIEAQSAGLKGSSYPSVKKALEAALGNASRDDLVLVSGSIFVVAEVV